MPRCRYLLCLLICALLSACTMAPPLSYAESRVCLERRDEMCRKLLLMLPPGQQKLPAAQREARWLADTVHKAAAAIARQYAPAAPSWINNRLVNSSWNLRERGLCWHYQHDLYRELRRRPLHYFRIGCCVLDYNEGSEHHCVYIAAAGKSWQDGIVFCAWWNCGKIKVWPRYDLLNRECRDEPSASRYLNAVYPAGHHYPMEHWARVKADEGGMRAYVNSFSKEGAETRQGKLMRENVRRGMLRRGGKAVDY